MVETPGMTEEFGSFFRAMPHERCPNLGQYPCVLAFIFQFFVEKATRINDVCNVKIISFVKWF